MTRYHYYAKYYVKTSNCTVYTAFYCSRLVREMEMATLGSNSKRLAVFVLQQHLRFAAQNIGQKRERRLC